MSSQIQYLISKSTRLTYHPVLCLEKGKTTNRTGDVMAEWKKRE